ncbi:MAG: hypothetical protein WC389_02100 [Lutibacter sp.]|jgi:hypothetical protein
MKVFQSILLILLFISCKSQSFEEKIFSCGNSTVKLEIPTIKDIQKHSFIEGETILITTEDFVIIEFHCGGNYSSHISDKNRYKMQSKKSNSLRGVDLKTGLFWRKDGKLIYSNCKVKDTARYNKIFDSKSIY